MDRPSIVKRRFCTIKTGKPTSAVKAGYHWLSAIRPDRESSEPIKMKRAEGVTPIPVEMQFFVVNCEGSAFLLSSLPIHLVEDLLVAQSGSAPTLARPRPVMLPG